MARLINAEVMGFFALPPVVGTMISRWLRPPDDKDALWRLLDPCAGEGAAARQIADLVGGNCQTWGVELSPRRAAQAATVLDQVHNTAWAAVRASDKSVSMLYLNPPYDHDLDGNERRLEIEFLRRSLSSLVYDGLLVYVIPQHLLGYQNAARLLAGHFKDLVVRRFPEGEYERFKQVVVFARRRPHSTPTNEAINAIRVLRDTDLPTLEQVTDSWPLATPLAPCKARFRRVNISDFELVSQALQSPWPTDMLAALTPQDQQTYTPPLPLKTGHVAMLLSAGLMGSVTIDQDGERLLVKGRVVKKQTRAEVADEKGKITTILRDKFVTTIGVVTQDEVQVIDNEGDLTGFMEKYGKPLAEHVLSNRPVYDLQSATDFEWQTVSALGLTRAALSGQKPGLLPAQKHLAIALARTLRQQGNALLQGEMGVGKTTIALADIELLDAYPAIVICPPHLVGKWQREAEAVIPGVQARILSRIGKLPGENRDVNDVRQFIADYASGKLGHKAIAIVSETMAKSGPGWQPGVAYRYRLPHPQNAGSEKFADLAQLRRETFHVAIQEYQKARVAFQTSLKSGDEPAILARQRVVMAQKRQAALASAMKFPVCPNCGQPRNTGELKNAGVCQERLQGWAHQSDGRRAYDDNGQPMWLWDATNEFAPLCNVGRHDFGRGRYRRWSIAEYIKSQAPRGFFKLLIADEVHEYRSKRSDRGVAFHQLIGATRYQLALTGTVYGGRSTSIFNLMYRLNFGSTVQDFRFNGEKQWAKQYGVLETRIYGGKGVSEDDDYSKFNARSRSRVTVTEKPGVSPAVLGRMINNVVFLTLQDLGVSLPPYREEMVTFALPAELAEQYRDMTSDLMSRAKSNRKWLSTWLQWSLARPNSAFRDEVVIKRERDSDGNVINEYEVMDLPAQVSLQTNGEPDPTDLLPKEEWLVNFVKAEQAAGRKVLVFVRQSGTRDIQPRLKSILSHAGLRTDVLRSNISTTRRETWINNRAPGLDALICNPRLVQTGLDLVQFSTVIFYEIQYDLYVIWQAMRRVWRLGQDQPVRVVFTAYEKTLEAQAIQLMGKKMKAAQLLYGDEVGGAIVPDDDDGNFLLELARSVLDGEQLPDFKTLFSTVQDQGETTSPLGSPTSTSVRVPVWTPERIQQFLLEEKQRRIARQQRRKRRAPTPVGGQAQLSLF